MFKTLIIHPADPTTDFCKQMYSGLDQIDNDEKIEFAKLFNTYPVNYFYMEGKSVWVYTVSGWVHYCSNLDQIDWFIKKGIDIRGWIEQGLAEKEN